MILRAGWRGGTDCFVVPQDFAGDTSAFTETDREKYLASWFMELTDACCC